MQVTKVTVSIGGMVQPRSFENIKRDLTIEAELGPEDDLDEVIEQIAVKGQVALGYSLVGDLRARFDVTDLWGVDDMDDMRTRLKANSIFEAVVANAPELDDVLVAEFWGKWETYQTEKARRVAELQAETEMVSDPIEEYDPDEDSGAAVTEDEYAGDDADEDTVSPDDEDDDIDLDDDLDDYDDDDEEVVGEL